MRRSLTTRFARCECGTAAVEFAIVSVVLVAVLVGIVDFGRTLYVKNQMSFLADQAARKVLLNPAITDATLTDELRDDFNAGVQADLGVAVTTETISGNNYRVVEVTYPMTLFVPLLTDKALVLNVTRSVPSG